MTNLKTLIEEQKEKCLKEIGAIIRLWCVNREKDGKEAHFAISEVLSSSQKALLEAVIKEIEGIKLEYPKPVLGMGGDMTSTFQRYDSYNQALQDIKSLFLEAMK